MSTILNLKVQGFVFSEMIDRVSLVTEFSNIRVDSSGNSHGLEAIRHIGVNSTHHQFLPLRVTNFYF